MVKAEDMAQVAPKYLGTPYSKLDCQAFVEKTMKDCGLDKNLAGSNAWYRLCMKEGWVGTPEECKQKFGLIPFGAFLFILSDNGKEPKRYQSDGIGNASHIGLYTGMTGGKMCEIARRAGVKDPDKYDFGNGAIHSSASRGCVCTSKFSGKTINGGWNRIGLWDKIDYDLKTDLKTEVDKMDTYQAKVVGGGLNLREQPDFKAERLCLIPNGEILIITDEAGKWAKTSYSGHTGWVSKDYIEPFTDEMVSVPKKKLETFYDEIGDWLGRRG